MHHERETTSESLFWKGSDICTDTQVTILPRNIDPSPAVVPVQFDASCLPPIGMEDNAESSARSRIAQLGGEVFKHSARMLVSLARKDKSKGFVFVLNWGNRAITLPQGIGFFRLYVEPNGNTLNGEEIEQLITEDKIGIEGEYGSDWIFDNKNLKFAKGIWLRMEDNKRKWIPPGDEPIIINGKIKDYRKVIDGLLEEVPSADQPILWIGQTIPINLDPSLEVILDEKAIKAVNEKDILRATGRQIHSRLIDGGKTNWGIRTEIISPTTKDSIPNFVHLRFISVR